MVLCLLTAKVFNHFNCKDHLRKFSYLFPLLSTCFFFVRLQRTLFSFYCIALFGKLCNLIVQTHDLVVHRSFESKHFLSLRFVHICDLGLFGDQVSLSRIESLVTITDFVNFRIVILVLVFDVLQKALVLLNRGLLLLDSLAFGLQDSELVTLALDLTITLLVLCIKLLNVLIAVSHHLCIVVEEGGVLDQTLLKLVIFFSELGLSGLELKLLLSKVLLLGQISLLVLVHLSALVKKTSCW